MCFGFGFVNEVKYGLKFYYVGIVAHYKSHCRGVEGCNIGFMNLGLGNIGVGMKSNFEISLS